MKKALVFLGLFISYLAFASPFTKGVIEPKVLYAIAIDGRSKDDSLLLQTLQGIVAQDSDKQIFLYLNSDTQYQPTKVDQANGLDTGSKFWLDYLKNNKKIIVKDLKNQDISSFIEKFKDYIKGAFIYRYNSYTPDLATTYAGISGKLPLTSSNKKIATTLGINIDDIGISKMYYKDFYTKFKDQINNAFGVELDPNEDLGPRDYATQHIAFVYYNASIIHPVKNVLKELFSQGNTPIFGWNASSGDEGNFVNRISQVGNFVVASDHSYNLSVYSSSKTKPKKAPIVNNKVSYDPNKVYVTFLVSDGDNLQFVTNKANDERWWGNEHRGEFPIGWTMPPALYYLEPDVWNYFVETATDNDEFVVGPSGIGYTFGSVTRSTDKFKAQQDDLNEFLGGSGINTVAVFGDGNRDFYINNLSDYLEQLSTIANAKGFFYAQFSPWMAQAKKHLGVVWSKNDKPIMPQNLYLDNDDDIQPITNILNSDSYQQGFYAIYAKRNDDDTTIDRLASINDSVRGNVVVVSPSQFVDLIKQSKK